MQTSVNPIGQPVAFAGLISSAQEVLDQVSGFNAEATAGIPFGAGVIQGTGRTDAKLPATGGKMKGIFAFSFEHAPGLYGDLDTNGAVIPKGRLNILRKGRVYVVIDQSITSIAPFSDRGYCRYGTNASDATLGAWSNASNSNQLDATKQVVFTSDVIIADDGTKIAEIEVDFTNAP